jgi:predicted amidophosphoribosyltransferase
MSDRTPKRPLTDAMDSAAVSLGLILFPSQCAICRMPLGMRAKHRLCQACFDMLEYNTGPRCHVCDIPMAQQGLSADGCTCPRCVANPPPFATLRAPFLYGGGLAEVVVASKFRHREDLAQALGQLLLMDARAEQLTHSAHTLVPIPLGPKRRRQRGYNLSTIMARVIGRAWRVPVRHALHRVHETEPQSQLTLAQRRENMQQAFAPRLPLSGPALLVDDVVTSAETARDAARAVIAAGASSVAVLAVARATLDTYGHHS